MRLQVFSTLMLSALFLVSCRDDPITGGGSTGPVKFDKYCSKSGLEPPVRSTVVLVDAQAVAEGKPEEFREKNPDLFSLLIGLGTPAQSLESGAMAPRERLTILVGTPANGQLSRVFTGCIPGLTQSELEKSAAEGGSGWWKQYMGSDTASDLADAQQEFLKQILLAVLQIKPAAKGGSASSFEESSTVKLLRALGPGSTTQGGVRRLFLFLNPVKGLEGNYEGVAEARTAGFAKAQDVAMDLGLSEIYLVPAGKAPALLDGEFLTSFIMGSKGQLRKVGPFSPDGLATVPTVIRTYSGEIQLAADFKAPIDIRLATTSDGELVASWFSYSSSNGVRSTPVVGRLACSDEDHCTLRGDPNGGMGQWWRTEPGSEPQPVPGGPFGGMRMIEATDAGGRLTGRVFDTVIYLEGIGDLKFSGKRVEGQGAL